LLFENYGQEVGGPCTLLSPNLKVGGSVSPDPNGCCAYGLGLRLEGNLVWSLDAESALKTSSTQFLMTMTTQAAVDDARSSGHMYM